MVVTVLGLAACATSGSRLARQAPARTPRPAPQVADGLWAMLDPGCPKPNLANFGAWPACASPFWISRGSAVVVRTRAAPSGKALDHSYRADLSLTGADPVIAELGNDRDGYLFLALTGLAHDDKGRLIAAIGAAVSCPGQSDGPISATPTAGGCEAVSADGVRKAAQATLGDPSVLTRVAWIAAGAP
jgi:hypothetical protein